jgi:hypothetical protein
MNNRHNGQRYRDSSLPVPRLLADADAEADILTS